ncbi:MAG TPA: tripartite tricarboxylate transporter substrate binding protein [Burkholderiales bacterium]|nr:tripartite tricarboxylate transporter substrate binding protein [Burkholderiales bacterium]
MNKTLLLLGAFLTLSAQAQQYPVKPVRMVVPFPPGGPVDAVTRIVAPKLGEGLGQQVIVDNRAGASGTIATGMVAKAEPDGYVLLIGTTTTITVSPNLYRNLPYDPAKDLQPITRFADVPSVLVVHPSIPAKSVRELVKIAKAQPGKLSYGSAGPGTSQHLAVELFKQMAGVDILHVPYKGGAPAMTDLLGGQIVMTIEPLNTALPQLRAGKLRGIAVTTSKRITSLPDLPPVSETLPGYEATLWISLLAPAGVRPQIVGTLHNAAVAALKASEVRERLAAQGASPIGDSVQDFAETIRRDTQKWSALVKKMGLKLD